MRVAILLSGALSACLISIATLLRRNGYLSLVRAGQWRIGRAVLAPVFKVSGSAFVEQVFMRIGFFAYAKIVAELGLTCPPFTARSDSGSPSRWIRASGFWQAIRGFPAGNGQKSGRSDAAYAH